MNSISTNRHRGHGGGTEATESNLGLGSHQDREATSRRGAVGSRLLRGIVSGSALWAALCVLCAPALAQPAPVLADPNSGLLFRPTSANFASGNSLQPAPLVIAKSANFTITAAQAGSWFNVTTGASNVTATLPTGAAGLSYYIRKADAGTGGVLFSPSAGGLFIAGHTVLIVWDTNTSAWISRSWFGSENSSGALTISAVPGQNLNLTTSAGGLLNISGHATIEGVTSTGATGTGNLVFSASPTFVTPALGAATATTLNALTLTAATTGFTLAGGTTSKTLTVSNTLALAGTDATTMTFPPTSATLARTDAANTFIGHQTFEGVTSTGATGTGNLVYSITPTLTGSPVVGGVTFSASAATALNSITAASATALTLGPGTNGTSLVLNTGASGGPTFSLANDAIFNVTTASTGHNPSIKLLNTDDNQANFILGTTATTSGTTAWQFKIQYAGGFAFVQALDNFNLLSWTLAHTAAGTALTAATPTRFSDTTSATSSTTGALQIGNTVAGTNVGIGGGNIFAGGTVNVGSSTASTSTTTGALQVTGGIGVQGAGFFGGNLTVSGTGTSSFAGTLVNDAGLTKLGTTGTNAYAWASFQGQGATIRAGGATYNDAAATGTVASYIANAFTGHSVQAGAATTITDYATIYVTGPNNSGNVTFSNGWCIWSTGKGRFDSSISLTSTNGSSNGGLNFGASGGDATLFRSAAGTLNISAATASTSTSTGALVLTGANAGLGVAGAIYGGSTLNLTTSTATAGIGGAALAQIGFRVVSSLSGNANQFGLTSGPTFGADALGVGEGLRVATNTIAASYTLPEASGIHIFNLSKGAGSSVTTQFGIQIDPLTSGGTNYAIYTGTGLIRLGDTTEATTGGAGSLTTAGGIYAAKKIVGNSDVISGGITQLKSYIVSGLPAASSYPGGMAYVTDATATTRLSTVAGTGSNHVVVFSDGTNWLIL